MILNKLASHFLSLKCDSFKSKLINKLVKEYQDYWKKFQFNLETVLRIRQIKVDEELKKLSIIVGNLNKLQNEINEKLKNFLVMWK